MNKFLDEAYIDLLVDRYALNESQMRDSVNINDITSLMFVPAVGIDKCSIAKFEYQQIPKLFSPLSMGSLEASGVYKVRNVPALGLLGQGVIMGIIDTGIEYQHESFRNADGTTRILRIWDQTINDSEGAPGGLPYGTEYTSEQINEALRSANPLDIVPSVDEVGHGTMIAGVASGNEKVEINFSGVAPLSELAVVKLKPAKNNIKNLLAVPENILCYQESDIMFASAYLIGLAERLNKPVVICTALGTSQGAHDGSTILARYTSYLSDISGVSLIYGTGNEANLGRHYYAALGPLNEADTFELNVAKGETEFFMELWSAMPSTLSIDITSPTGEYTAPIPPNRTDCRVIRSVFESSVLWVFNVPIESQSGNQLIHFRFQNPQEGIWKFKVYNINRLSADFHVWLPQANIISTGTYFLRSNPDTTLLIPSTAMEPMSITAYNNVDGSIYINAGRGFTASGITNPDLAAPGVNILHPALQNTYATSTGTGIAAAHTAGIVAMFYEWSFVKGNNPSLDGQILKNLLIRGAEREPNTVYPNTIFGYGKINVFRTFELLRQQSAKP